MGVGGHFWDLLKPYGRSEGFDFLRNKRVAVDLSYWIVQHETAIKGYTRNPHLRLTFFRTINLFSKFGAFPVFVVDGTPSYLKSQARMQRFYRGSGTDISSWPVPEDGVSVERNGTFQKLVQECVELLELLGMPVLRASGEAEALCAQLNRDGYVDACITADSDAFLYGAKCVIKRLSPNSKEPLECYHMSDIEAGLGLNRSHLIAVSLLVGNDHDLNGVLGVGVDTALRFVKAFSEDDILNRLQEIGRGDMVVSHDNIDLESELTTEETSKRSKSPHCSVCGHPGSKRAHDKSACQYCCCDKDKGCIQKPPGFKCSCSVCDLDRELKHQKNCRDWQMKVCKKIHLEKNFPNKKIIKMYMNDDRPIDEGQHMSWVDPRTDLLVDLLAYSQNWEPSYIRQRMLPLLSTIYLRDVASKQNDELLCGQYEFNSIQRLKIRFGYQLFVVKWKQAARTMTDCVPTTPRTPNAPQELGEAEEAADQVDEPDVPQVYIEDGCWFLLTDEDIELVRNAFPEKVDEFYKEKEEKSKRKTPKSESQSPRGRQLSIKEFYRATKVISKVTPQENADGSCGKSEDSPEGKRRGRTTNYSKSVRRKLLFD